MKHGQNRAISWICLLVPLVALMVVHQPATAGNPESEAKLFFARGETAYRLRNFAVALDNFRAALQRLSQPSILFNMAQCYRQLDLAAEALFYYRLYRTEWRRHHRGRAAPNDAEVRGFIRRLVAVQRARLRSGRRFDLTYRVEARKLGGKLVEYHQDGEALKTGDRVRFIIRTSRPTYLYIVLLASDGRLVRLYPQAGIALKNPIKPSREIYIPNEAFFELDKTPGVENLYILASLRPIPLIEQRLGSLPGQYSSKDKRLILASIDELRCPGQETTTRGMHLTQRRPTTCGKRRTRGLRLTKPVGRISYVLRTNKGDDKIILRHRIIHR